MNAFVKKQLKKVNFLFERWMNKRVREVKLPENVEVFTDIPYGEDGRSCHLMDIYRPATTPGPLPVIVNFHGGGMLLCTKEVNRFFCAELARRGFLVFCVDYPLVPDAAVPEILRDVSRGMDAADSLIESYGGDRTRVYQVGDSAGAFLSVYAVAAQKNPAIARAGGFSPSGLPVKALGLISGMYYTTGLDSVGLFLRKDFYGKKWRTHPLRPYLNPADSRVADNLPPCILITSGSDNLRGYTLKFHRGLKRAGIPCRLLDYPLLKNLQHDFAIVKPEHPDAQHAIDSIAEFLLQY